MKSGSDKDKGTFLIKIISRKNSTWQGNITWVEKREVQNFKSALELLKLIDGALDEDAETEGESHEEE